ncbi:MAG: thioredoxin family protein [Rhizomicrobium sp.]
MENLAVSREEWLIARKALLEREGEEIGLRDEINGMRLKMPRFKIEKDYTFDTGAGRKRLSDLFDGRSQLLIYHFMYGPDWGDACLRCSFVADHINGGIVHLNNHDVTWTAVSRAPLNKIEAYKNRMGWTFPWVSSFGTEFNHDFNVSFTPEEMATGSVSYNYGMVPSGRVSDEMSGLSSFFKDTDGAIYHTYSAYQRSLESLGSALMALDRAPLGRNETSSLSFVRRHDEYAAQ